MEQTFIEAKLIDAFHLDYPQEAEQIMQGYSQPFNAKDGKRQIA